MTRSTLPLLLLSRIVIDTRAGLAPSAGAMDANDDGFPDASRMPVALCDSATVRLPTAVSGAPAPSLSVSVATAPEVDTLPSVPALGTFASVQGAVSVDEARVSLNVTVIWSTFPLPFTSFITIAVSTGAMPSLGAVAAKLARFPAGSRIPAALLARVTVNEPTVVSTAPAPSDTVSVAVEPATATLASVPPLGTFASVQGAVPAVYEASGSENVTVTVSSLPGVPPRSPVTIDESVGFTVSFVRVIDVVGPASPYELVDQALIVNGPSARLDTLTAPKVRVPPPVIPAAVALSVDDPSPTVRWTVSPASDVAGSATSNESDEAFAALTKALPVPPPFVSVIEVGASGATVTVVLWAPSAPVHRW